MARVVTAMDSLTVLIITCNEEANIERTLEGVNWARQILVIDSHSSDATLDILRRYPQVQVYQRRFRDFADQCNFGLSQVKTPWVLSIDADYVFPPGSEPAIAAAMTQDLCAHQAEFDYCISGEPVRGSILPPRTVLYRVEDVKYENDGHGHRVVVSAKVGTLPFRIRHDDRKPLSRWLQSQVVYARQEAQKLLLLQNDSLNHKDRIRKGIVFAPWMVFLLVYVIRGGFLSGWRGLYYALQRFTAELLLSLFLIDAKLGSRVQKNSQSRRPDER